MKRFARFIPCACPRNAPKLLGFLACAAGCCLCALPTLASGTTAGTAISNTAAATYTDPNNPGQTLNATSNTVSVTVAEVAGLTVAAAGATDVAGHAQPLPGDVVNYDYTVTNVGNDPTQVVVPGSAVVTGPGAAGTLQYKVNAGAFANVAAGGVTSASIAPGQTVTVRVPVTVGAGAATGQTLAVLLGDTGANDNSAGTQNQAFSADGSGRDVHTLDNADGSVAGEVAGAPVNGEREASATQNTTIGAQPQAFALLGLTHTAFTAGATAQSDVLTYGLTLAVQSAVPSGAAPSLVAADLTPMPITVGGTTVSDVLIADVIPAGTVLTGVPAVPSGWTVLYSTTDPTTANANAVNWVTTAPTDLTTVRRVGFAGPSTVAKGSTVSGFSFQVITTGASTTAATAVANIAQAFGQTSGDPTNALVYDESGYAAPSNFNDDGSRGSSTPTSGVASPAADGTDTSNNDTGSGVGGEDNVYTVQPDGTVLNGPGGQPGATGPTDTNDDFSNLSAAIPAGTAPGATLDPAPVTFSNTFSNPSANPILSKIYLVPLPPATVPGGHATDLPSGTKVTITQGGSSALYTYDGTNFALTTGPALQINGLAAGSALNYTVAVDLPAGTALSTTTGTGFPVPLEAYVDSNANGVLDSGEPANTTIDRVYTGFLKLTKQARILAADGTTIIQDFTASPTSANMEPGRFIVYQITYDNISTPPIGSGNVTLSANALTIDEDGAALPNNWARDNDANGTLDTSHVPGNIADSGTGAAITFFNGASASNDNDPNVTRYVDTLSVPVTPGQSRTFTFRRKIN